MRTCFSVQNKIEESGQVDAHGMVHGFCKVRIFVSGTFMEVPKAGSSVHFGHICSFLFFSMTKNALFLLLCKKIYLL